MKISQQTGNRIAELFDLLEVAIARQVTIKSSTPKAPSIVYLLLQCCAPRLGALISLVCTSGPSTDL